MNELIKNIEILAKITYKEFLIAYETYLYIIRLEEYALELNKYESTIKNLLIVASVEYNDVWEKINIEHIKSELNPKVKEKIPIIPIKK